VAAREDFTRLTGPYRRELIAHCYRMTGSLDEAEDLVQETYLRAWRAAEVAGLLGTTPAAVNNVLRRARARLAEAGPDPDTIREPPAPGLAAEYATAFRDADIDALIRLLASDAVLEMPPLAAWFRGPAAIGRFLAGRVLTGPGVMRLVPAPANGKPGFACYLRHGDGGYRAHAVQVLEPHAAGLGRITIFLDPGLFASFGLPPVLAPDRAVDLDLMPA